MTTPIDRESVERLAHILHRTPLYYGHGEESDIPEEALDTLLALRAALDAAEAENKRLREALDHIANGAGEYRSDEIGKAAMDVARASLRAQGET